MGLYKGICVSLQPVLSVVGQNVGRIVPIGLQLLRMNLVPGCRLSMLRRWGIPGLIHAWINSACWSRPAGDSQNSYSAKQGGLISQINVCLA